VEGPGSPDSLSELRPALEHAVEFMSAERANDHGITYQRLDELRQKVP